MTPECFRRPAGTEDEPESVVKIRNNFMNEKPKSIWKKSWKGSRWLGAWLILTVLIFSVIVALGETTGNIHGWHERWPVLFETLIVSLMAATVFVVFWAFLRWVFCWRNFKRFLFGLACFATLIALFYAEEDWRGKHDWEKFKHEWEAKGEHFDFASVIPKPVPDDQNFALTPVVASCYSYILTREGKRIPNEQRDTNLVNQLAMDILSNKDNWKDSPTNGNWLRQTKTDLLGWQQYYRTLAAKTNEFQVPEQPQSPAADVLLALSKYDSTIEELRQASQLPYSRFPLNYDTECPATILLPHLAAFKRCAQLLQLRSIAELQAGQPEKALADVALALRLIESIRTEPFIISQLVRIALLQMVLQPVWEGLAERKWSDAQLVELDAELAKLEFVADYDFSLRGERGMNDGLIEYLRHAPNRFKDLISYDSGNESSENKPRMQFEMIALAYGPSGWYDQSKLRICRFYDRWYLRIADDKAKVFIPAALQGADAAIGQEVKNHWNPCSFLERILLPALGGMARKCSSAQISVDLARTAIALERYRLVHGKFPESLDALAPQFIAQVPHDVIGGQPLHYRRTADGQFVLYSVGWNEKDDGGIVFIPKGGSQPKFDEGDWVWRYPQK